MRMQQWVESGMPLNMNVLIERHCDRVDDEGEMVRILERIARTISRAVEFWKQRAKAKGFESVPLTDPFGEMMEVQYQGMSYFVALTGNVISVAAHVKFS